MNKKIFLSLSLTLLALSTFAGNPDRQGEAGAYELLLNPWARTAGLHAMNTASVRGIEAMSLNVAGLSFVNKFEVGVSHSIYLQGTGLAMNALGLANKVGKNGTFGVSINALSLGYGPTLTNPGQKFQEAGYNSDGSFGRQELYIQEQISFRYSLTGPT